jgi:hypothetical protein
MVDHIDRSKTNNMFNNLRWYTSSENQRNRAKPTNNTSGTQGIAKVKTSWVAKWNDNEGMQKDKSFNIKTYGEEQAKALAIAYLMYINNL